MTPPADLPPLPSGWTVFHDGLNWWADLCDSGPDDRLVRVGVSRDWEGQEEPWAFVSGHCPVSDLLAVLAHLKARAERGET